MNPGMGDYELVHNICQTEALIPCACVHPEYQRYKAFISVRTTLAQKIKVVSCRFLKPATVGSSV